jgi:hypothetical protein
MNRKELLARIAVQLNKSDVLDARTQTRLIGHLNIRHRQIMSTTGLAGLRRRQYRFSVVAGQARNALFNGENIKHIRDLTNDRELSQRSLGVYRVFNPDPITNPGTPDAFIQFGFEPVANQPSDVVPGTPVELFVVSSFAGDIAPLTATITSASISSTVTLNGTTPVSFGAGLLWTYLDKFYLSAIPGGIVTLHAQSGAGPYLSAIGSGRTSAQWLAFYLDPTPSGPITYDVDAEFITTDLAADTDEPQLPNDFHDLLELGAIMDELHHLDDSRTLLFQERYNRRFGELKLKLARQGMDTGPRGVSSRLGPWAPAGRW